MGYAHTVKGQNSTNYLSVSQLPLSPSLTSIFDLENEKIVTEGITLYVRSVRSYFVFARVTNRSSSNGMLLPANLIKLFLNRSVESPNSRPVRSQIILSDVDQKVLEDPNRTLSTGDFYYYNFHFGPIGFDYPPGNYSMTILFTMTQP
jgi:hypothetical protein